MKVQKISVTGEGSSVEFSRVVYGIWRWSSLDDNQRSAIFNKCLQLGITTFDGADIYGGHTSEQHLGKVLELNPHVKREDIQIITKCGICLGSERHPEFKFNHYDTTKEYIIKSVNQTLADVRTSYVDLLLIHRPDFLMDPDEVAEAFAVLKKEGKVRNFGVSNFTPSQFDMLSYRLAKDTPLITNQVELSPVAAGVLSDGTLDQCIKYRIKPMLWSPLRHLHDKSIDVKHSSEVAAVVDEIASAHHTSSDKVTLAWGLQHPSQPFTIIGTTKLDRIEIAADAPNIKLTRAEWFKVWCAGVGRAGVP